MGVSATHYARSGDLQIAYQVVVDEGPLDIVMVLTHLSNIEMYWDLLVFARFYGDAVSHPSAVPVKTVSRKNDASR